MSILKDSQAFKIILVKLFNDILEYEENVLSTSEFKDLTNNDIHVISAIGTLTISINGLVRKGYVIKERSEKDKRVVFVNLSKKGEKAFIKNEELYDAMVNSMIEGLDDMELDILMSALRKVNTWIKKKMD